MTDDIRTWTASDLQHGTAVHPIGSPEWCAAILADHSRLLERVGELEKVWHPIDTLPFDGEPVVLGNPEWDGYVTETFISCVDGEERLKNWRFGPTVWMRPTHPRTPNTQASASGKAE